MRETKQPARRKAAKDFFASSSLCAWVTLREIDSQGRRHERQHADNE